MAPRGLDQQRRFADAGIAAHQQHRAAHEAAAGDAVEFGDAGGQAGRVMGFAGQRLEREQAAFARRPAGAGGALGAFLGQRVPFAAGLAFALPAAAAAAPQFWQMKVRLRLDIRGIRPSEMCLSGTLKRP